MSRFRFRLQRVLGVRRIEEEIARAQWLELEQRASLVESEAQALRSSLDDALHDLARSQSKAVLGPSEVLLSQSLVERLRERWVQRTIQASQARREAERLRQVMSDRRVRVRGLETLESRARQDWRQDGEALANAELDERASLLRAHRAAAALPKNERAHEGAWNQP